MMSLTTTCRLLGLYCRRYNRCSQATARGQLGPNRSIRLPARARNKGGTSPIRSWLSLRYRQSDTIESHFALGSGTPCNAGQSWMCQGRQMRRSRPSNQRIGREIRRRAVESNVVADPLGYWRPPERRAEADKPPDVTSGEIVVSAVLGAYIARPHELVKPVSPLIQDGR